MSALDPKREAFLLAFIETGNASEAYRRSHNTKASAKTIHEKASRLLAEGKVKARFAELHGKVEAKAVDQLKLTLEDHMTKLEELRDAAYGRGQLSAAIAAEVKRGELRRFYVKQVETGPAGEFERMSDEELRQHVAGEARELGVASPLSGTKH